MHAIAVVVCPMPVRVVAVPMCRIRVHQVVLAFAVPMRALPACPVLMCAPLVCPVLMRIRVMRPVLVRQVVCPLPVLVVPVCALPVLVRIPVMRAMRVSARGMCTPARARVVWALVTRVRITDRVTVCRRVIRRVDRRVPVARAIRW